MRINTTIQHICIFTIKNDNGKTPTLNYALIPTPVTPRFISMNSSAHDSPNRERTTNVEGGKFKLQDITCHNHSSAWNENAETQTSIQKDLHHI